NATANTADQLGREFASARDFCSTASLILLPAWDYCRKVTQCNIKFVTYLTFQQLYRFALSLA
ncbi:MAG: hypothetical protein E7K08_17920, partial [Citrobacter freundii]